MDNSLVWFLILYFLGGGCCEPDNCAETRVIRGGCQPNCCNPINLVMTCLFFSSCLGTSAQFLPGNANPVPSCPNAAATDTQNNASNENMETN